MILSKYNHLFTRNDKNYIFNSETCFFCEISKSVYDLIKDRDFDLLDVDTLNLLKDKKVLIESSQKDNFFFEDKLKHQLKSFNQDILSLILVPTLLCNFDCPYCFESNKINSKIDHSFIDKLIRFINEHEKAKKIAITWYGGEPLLGFRQIQEILSNIEKIEDKIIISQSLVTNGYLLSSKIIDYFKKHKLTSIQITIDGEEDTHNNTRFLKKSLKPTFKTIVSNIDNLVDIFPECKISIRININKNNMDEYISLNKKMTEKWGNKVIIYPGFIRQDTRDGRSLCSSSIFSDEIFSFYQTLRKNGIQQNLYPKKVVKGCMINSINSYIIGPKGEIYKCWNDVSNEDKIIGYIDRKEIINKELFHRYLNISPFEDKKCRECFLLPLCSGGCGWYRYRNIYEKGKFDLCDFKKNTENLEEILLSSL